MTLVSRAVPVERISPTLPCKAPKRAGAFRPGEDPAEVSARLYDAGVIVRFIPGTDLVRVSCGWWNNEDDLERLLAAL